MWTFIMDSIQFSLAKLMPFILRVFCKAYDAFLFFLYIFLRKIVRHRVSLWKLLRQRMLWWSYPSAEYKPYPIAWSISYTDGWIPMEVRSCMWIFLCFALDLSDVYGQIVGFSTVVSGSHISDLIFLLKLICSIHISQDVLSL